MKLQVLMVGIGLVAVETQVTVADDRAVRHDFLSALCHTRS